MPCVTNQLSLHCSLRPRLDGVQRNGAGLVLRDPLELALLPGAQGNQPHPPDDLHLQPAVLRVHERKGKNNFAHHCVFVSSCSTGCPIWSVTFVGLTLIRMFHHVIVLTGQFCLIPVCRSRIYQKVEQPKSKSTNPRSQTRWYTLGSRKSVAVRYLLDIRYGCKASDHAMQELSRVPAPQPSG